MSAFGDDTARAGAPRDESAGEIPGSGAGAGAGDADDQVTPDSIDPAPETEPGLIERLANGAQGIARERLREELETQAVAAREQHAGDIDPAILDRIADEEAERVKGALLRLSIAEAIAQELGIGIGEALGHPAAARAHEHLRARARQEASRGTVASREPMLLVDAVHLFGIETVEPGDRDIELRFARTGIDVHRPSTSSTLGRLRWDDIKTVSVQRPRRGLPGLRRSAQLVVGTDRGEVTFELIGLSDEEITDHLEPLIARNCEGFRGAAAT